MYISGSHSFNSMHALIDASESALGVGILETNTRTRKNTALGRANKSVMRHQNSTDAWLISPPTGGEG